MKYILKIKSLENRKKREIGSQFKIRLAKFIENFCTWGAQGKMTQLNLIFNSLPRDLTEFSFFVLIGFVGGSLGLI